MLQAFICYCSYVKCLGHQWLSWRVLGVIGSALGLAGPVSVNCDRVRWKV